MPSRIHIGLIECSVAVETKINAKHGLTLQDVRDALQAPSRPLRASWLDASQDPRGPRLVAEGFTSSGRRLKAVLYPVDGEGTWRLGTAVL